MKNKKLLTILLSFIILFIPINQFSFALGQKDLAFDESLSNLNVIPLNELVGLFAYFGLGPASIAAIKTWLGKAGFAGLVSSVSFIASSFETYQVNSKKADHYWGMI